MFATFGFPGFSSHLIMFIGKISVNNISHQFVHAKCPFWRHFVCSYIFSLEFVAQNMLKIFHAKDENFDVHNRVK